MKKRLLILVCALALLVGCLALSALAADTQTAYCQACKQDVTWEPFQRGSIDGGGPYHYYLTQDYDTDAGQQISVINGAKVCIDLRGHTYHSNDRAFAIQNAGSTLSIMDTVGGGQVIGKARSNNPGGGTFNLTSNTTLNLYGGTLSFVHDPNGSYGGTGRGGVISNGGTFNMYGGKIIGGQVVDCTYENFNTLDGVGGAIYNAGTLNLLGGQITAGSVPTSGAGPCIYVGNQNTTITLGGNAQVADIYYPTLNPDKLIVNDDYTGKVTVSYDSSVKPIEGTQIGLYSAETLTGTVNWGDQYAAVPSDGTLILSKYPAGTVAATDGNPFDTSLQDAVNAATEGAVVELIKDHTGNITVNKTITLQMNGRSIFGTVTVAEGCTLYGMDATTDDHTVADGKYGKITQVVGNVAGLQTDDGVNYLKVTEDGVLSFHCVTLEIYAMTLRVSNKNEPGLYYKSNFHADEKAAPLLSTYGIALSVKEIPNASNIDTVCQRSVFHSFEGGPSGNIGNSSSTLLSGIMKKPNGTYINSRNMDIDVYGRPYAITVDGQHLFGNTATRSLADQLNGINQVVSSLSSVQVRSIAKLYYQFKSVLGSRGYSNIQSAWEEKESGTLKVLVLGNSHGLDATNLLYEVFQTEAPEQDVVIGALYYSGCEMSKHAEFLTGNKREYTYHKNDGTQPNNGWLVRTSTCLDALQDEQWDIIFLQQMNNWSAVDDKYKDGSWKTVVDYLLNNQDVAPKLGFHMVWANPDDDTLLNTGDASWKANHEKYWKNSTTGKYDQSLQYQGIVSKVQQYLVNSTSTLGRKLDMVLPVGTAIQYAQDVCNRPQNQIYRDYTHVSDYGRLIAAYTWYAEIMGLTELTDVKMDEIPAHLKHQNSKFPAVNAGKYPITQDMKDDLMASVNWALENPFSLPVAE